MNKLKIIFYKENIGYEELEKDGYRIYLPPFAIINIDDQPIHSLDDEFVLDLYELERDIENTEQVINPLVCSCGIPGDKTGYEIIIRKNNESVIWDISEERSYVEKPLIGIFEFKIDEYREAIKTAINYWEKKKEEITERLKKNINDSEVLKKELKNVEGNIKYSKNFNWFAIQSENEILKEPSLSIVSLNAVNINEITSYFELNNQEGKEQIKYLLESETEIKNLWGKEYSEEIDMFYNRLKELDKEN